MRLERDDHVRDEHVTSLATGAGRFITSVTARLFEELARAPVPIDMRVVRQLSRLRSRMAMDI